MDAYAKFVRAIRQWTLNSISIRLRLALWYGTLLFVTLTLFSIIVFAVAQFQLENSVDQSLQSRASAHCLNYTGRAARGSKCEQLRYTVATSTATPQPAPTQHGSGGGRADRHSFATPVPTVDPTQQAKIQHPLQVSSTVSDLLGRLDLTFEVLNAKGKRLCTRLPTFRAACYRPTPRRCMRR